MKSQTKDNLEINKYQTFIQKDKIDLLNINKKIVDDSDEDLDDETWISKKKEFWKRNNILPYKIKGGILPQKN
jgi:hypothetical protein